MAQLKMLLNVEKCDFPADRNGFSFRKFTGSIEDIYIWLEICKNGLAKPEDGIEKYENSMLKQEGYKISDTYFITYGEKCVGTVTALVFDEKKQGCMHMVAAIPEVRGKGIGSYMADIVKYEFYSRGCETAYLTTDEFRVPAVKSYLSAGFRPVLYDSGMEDRWLLWLTEHGYSDIDMLDESGNFVKKLLPSKPPVKIGIFGARRGCSFAHCIKLSNGIAVVHAVCDMDNDKHELIKPYCEEDTVFTTDFNDFIKSGCDAIILCNYFNEHTKYAVKCLENGIHVLSETTACATLEECVQLCEAVEKSGKTYMLAENYGYMYPVQLLKKIYDDKKIGEAVYMEGEYVHPMTAEEYARYTPSSAHWRANMPSCYYSTHSLAPLMRITDTIPVSVNCRSIYTDAVKIEKDGEPVKDVCGIMLVNMSNSSLARVTGWAKFGVKGDKYRITCSKGTAETVTGNETQVLLQLNNEIYKEEKETVASFDSAELYSTKNSRAAGGHLGGDYFATLDFIDCILNNKKPFYDVYKATAMSACAILAWRSSLEHGKEYIIPDFSDKNQRDTVRNDNLSPFPDKNGKVNLPCTELK